MDIFIPWHCVVVTCRLSLSQGGWHHEYTAVLQLYSSRRRIAATVNKHSWWLSCMAGLWDAGFLNWPFPYTWADGTWTNFDLIRWGILSKVSDWFTKQIINRSDMIWKLPESSLADLTWSERYTRQLTICSAWSWSYQTAPQLIWPDLKVTRQLGSYQTAL